MFATEVGAIGKGDRAFDAVGSLGDVHQPHLEEAELDQNQLVVLGELTEAGNALGELDHPLDAGRDEHGQVLPQLDLLQLERLRHRANVWRGAIVT